MWGVALLQDQQNALIPAMFHADLRKGIVEREHHCGMGGYWPGESKNARPDDCPVRYGSAHGPLGAITLVENAAAMLVASEKLETTSFLVTFWCEQTVSHPETLSDPRR